jgi:hypothetical protein
MGLVPASRLLPLQGKRRRAMSYIYLKSNQIGRLLAAIANFFYSHAYTMYNSEPF